jgi:hypothetical protein
VTGQTMLHRQIHPAFFRNGRVESPAFRPSSKDVGKLSTEDGDRITAEAAWVRYTTVRRFESVGSMAVTVDDCARIALPVIADGGTDPELSAEHVSIDFNGLDRKQTESKSKKLRDAAVTRNWTHRP